MSEVGIIGQMYEDRRTKKRGKLVERDDKYKTLLLESEDGKSFNVSFGGFKSNWRSVDEPVETIEEALQEVEIPEPEKKPVKVKKERKKQAPRQLNSILEETTLHVLDYVKSFNDVRVSASAEPRKKKVTLKVDNHRIFIIDYMVRRDIYQICVFEDFFLRIKDKKYLIAQKYNENWQSMKYSFMVERPKLDVFLEDARKYIIDAVFVKEEEDK